MFGRWRSVSWKSCVSVYAAAGSAKKIAFRVLDGRISSKTREKVNNSIGATRICNSCLLFACFQVFLKMNWEAAETLGMARNARKLLKIRNCIGNRICLGDDGRFLGNRAFR